MKLLLVACLVAVCNAAPPVPNIPQVFCGSGEYRFKSRSYGNWIFLNFSCSISNFAQKQRCSALVLASIPSSGLLEINAQLAGHDTSIFASE